jgi:hypothetical protein
VLSTVVTLADAFKTRGDGPNLTSKPRLARYLAKDALCPGVGTYG